MLADKGCRAIYLISFVLDQKIWTRKEVALKNISPLNKGYRETSMNGFHAFFLITWDFEIRSANVRDVLNHITNLYYYSPVSLEHECYTDLKSTPCLFN